MTFIPIRLVKEFESEVILFNSWHFTDGFKGQNVLIAVLFQMVISESTSTLETIWKEAFGPQFEVQY